MDRIRHIGILSSLLVLLFGIMQGQTNLKEIEDRLPEMEGVEKLKAINGLGQAYLKVSPRKAIEFGVKVPPLSREMRAQEHVKKGDPNFSVRSIRRCETDAHNIMGQAFEQLKNKKNAVRNYKRALQLAKIAEYPEGKQFAERHLAHLGKGEGFVGKIAGVFENLEQQVRDGDIDDKVVNVVHKSALAANQFYAREAEKKGNYKGAIEFHLRTIRYHSAARDTAKVRAVYARVSELYTKLGDKKKATDYLELSQGQNKNAEGLTYSYSEAADSPTPSTDEKVLVQSRGGDDVDEVIKDIKTVQNVYEELSTPTEISEDEAKTLRAKESAQREARKLERQGNYAAANRKNKEVIELIAMLDAYKAERQMDSLSRDLFFGELIGEISTFKTQGAKDKEFRNFLIITLILLGAIAGLIGYLFITKRNSHKALGLAFEELDETHQTLKSTQMQLVSAEKMASLGQLTAGIAHEINNPVNFISGNIHPLKSDFNDLITILQAYEKAAKDAGETSQFEQVEALKKELEIDFVTEEILSLLAGIEEGAGRTTEIVKGLRTFARMDEEEPKLFEIHGGLDATISLLKNQSDKVEFIRDYGDLPVIEGFPGRLNQVFMNVLTNAIQAMPDGGWVHLKTTRISDKIEVCIQDTGAGIRPENQAKIFEPFFTTKDVGEGTGLGLSISLGILKAHSGSIEIESEPGHGTKVCIRLPITFQDKKV